MNGTGESAPEEGQLQPVPILPIKQEPGIKKFGRHGDIKRLMKVLSKRNEYIDLYLICQDGKLGCHKFIIGSQSRFLRLLIESANPEGDDCTIVFPDVKSQHMEVVLKFLYTGKLAITRADSNIIKELLERVLHIDAKVTLPDNIAPPAAKPSSSPGGSGGGTGGSPPSASKRDHPPPSGGDSSTSNGHDEPAEKRSRNDQPPPSQAPEEEACENKSELRARLGLPASSSSSLAPPTPPHELEYDESEVEILPAPEKPAPELVSLDEEQDQASLNHLRLFQAPKIISKRTGGGAPSNGPNDTSSGCPAPGPSNIPAAPKVVCKSTGYHPVPRVATKVKTSAVPTTDKVVNDVSDHVISDGEVNITPPAPNERLIVKKRQDTATLPGPPQDDDVFLPSTPPVHIPAAAVERAPAQQSVRATRTSTGSLQRAYLNEEALIGGNQDDVQPVAQMELASGLDGDDNDSDCHPGQDSRPGPSSSFKLPLPPGLAPGPEGYVIHRGKWVPESSIEKFKKKSHQGSFRRYNYNPITITGQMKDSTAANFAQPDGRWPCDQCPNVYSKQASLISHKSRIHNPKLKVKCPECPKLLSHKAAVAKHLLSHRPEEQWPYQCHCGKYFQAKGDIPKHWKTSKHLNDPKIPPDGSPEWRALLDATERFKLQQWYAQNGGTIPMEHVQVTVDNGDAESTAGESVAGSDFDFDPDDDLVFEPAAAVTDDSTELRPPPPLEEGETGTDSDGAPPPPPPGRRNSDGSIVVERPVRDTPTPFNISDILDG